MYRLNIYEWIGKRHRGSEDKLKTLQQKMKQNIGVNSYFRAGKKC